MGRTVEILGWIINLLALFRKTSQQKTAHPRKNACGSFFPRLSAMLFRCQVTNSQAGTVVCFISPETPLDLTSQAIHHDNAIILHFPNLCESARLVPRQVPGVHGHFHDDYVNFVVEPRLLRSSFVDPSFNPPANHAITLLAACTTKTGNKRHLPLMRQNASSGKCLGLTQR